MTTSRARKTKTRSRRSPETGIKVEPEPSGKSDAEWAKGLLVGADNRTVSVFDSNPRMVELVRLLVVGAANENMQISRSFIRRAVQDRLGIQVCEATFTRYFNGGAPKDIQEAWNKTRRSRGFGMG